MRRYSEEVKEFIAANVKGITTKELAILVNTKFGTDFTDSKMKAYKSNYKLKSGTPGGWPKGTPSKQFPKEIKKFIEINYKGVGPKDMTDLLNITFGTNYTYNQINAYYKNHKLNSGITGRFTKGHIPANKGKKGVSYEGMKATQFKKGHRPANWVPIGTERTNRDGYVGGKSSRWKIK